MKRKKQGLCSCEDIPFTLIYESEEKKTEFFCPFCGSVLEEPEYFESEEDE